MIKARHVLARAKFNILSRLRRSWALSRLRRQTKFAPINRDLGYAKNKRNHVGYFLPYATLRTTDYRQLFILSNGFHKHLYDKYTCKGYEILDTDTVIDCGAFVGGFSVAAVRAGAIRVISIEPSSRNYRCLELNLCLQDAAIKVEPLKLALGNHVGMISLNLSASGCDDSILEPDEGALKSSELVAISTLAEIITTKNIVPTQLFLKVEAEGYEPEILHGLGNIMPRVIVVDVTAERNGQSPRSGIHLQLSNAGYESIEHTQRCIFAKLNNT